MLIFDHWTEARPARSADGQEQAGRRADLLEAVIERSTEKRKPRPFRPLYLVFPTSAYESRFKSCLSRVPVDCRTERLGRREIIALRPKNVEAFGELVRTSGLANCDASNRAVEYLRANPDEFLRFQP